MASRAEIPAEKRIPVGVSTRWEATSLAASRYFVSSAGDITSAALFSDLAGTRTPTPLPIVVTPPAPAWDADLKARLTRGEPIALEDELLRVERALVEQALETTRDNLTEAAHLLGISFRQIRYKVRQLGLR